MTYTFLSPSPKSSESCPTRPWSLSHSSSSSAYSSDSSISFPSFLQSLSSKFSMYQLVEWSSTKVYGNGKIEELMDFGLFSSAFSSSYLSGNHMWVFLSRIRRPNLPRSIKSLARAEFSTKFQVLVFDCILRRPFDHCFTSWWHAGAGIVWGLFRSCNTMDNKSFNCQAWQGRIGRLGIFTKEWWYWV